MNDAGDPKAKRVDVGFAGGQVLSLRLQEAAYQVLRQALEESGDQRWQEVEAEDSLVTVDLGQVVYVRLDTEKQRVGF